MRVLACSWVRCYLSSRPACLPIWRLPRLVQANPSTAPETFNRGLYFRFFQVPAPIGQYTLSVQNGSPTGQNRVDSAVITLNAKVVVGLRDLTAKTASVTKTVTLSKLNVLTFLVTGKKGSFITFSINGQTANTPPVANAGADQTGQVATTITLDGSASSDFDGDLLTYNWNLTSKPTGSAALLTGPNTANPTFFLDKPGTYIGSLVVNDGLVNSAPDTVTVSTLNSPPTANAGANQTARVNDTVTLDGSGSNDPDGNPLAFFWTLTTKPTGSTAQLSSTTAVNPTFTVDKPGTYVAQLIVNDGTVNSIASQAAISTENTPPVAHAGPDQSVSVNNQVILDGSASSDVDGDPLTYTWSFTSIPNGSAAVLTDPAAVQPTFTVDKPGSYALQLIARDGTANSLADTVVITTLNSKPVANAGAAQSAIINQQVTLNGIDSTDADNDTLAYAWSFVSRPQGSAAQLSDTTAPQPTFTLDKSGTYVIQLIVNDGTVDSDPATVTISTLNSKPVADAGTPQTVPVTTLVKLNGLASSDADGDSLAYAWSFTTKPATSTAVLSNATIAEPTFAADVAGTYVAQLVVNDGTIDSDPSTVVITVTDNTSNDPAITGISPVSAPIGSQITLTGVNLLTVGGGCPTITLKDQHGNTITALVVSCSDTQIVFTIPAGAATGLITVTVNGQVIPANSPTGPIVVTVVPANSYGLSVQPSQANLLQGTSVTFTFDLQNSTGFTGLAALSLTGLPPGVNGSFRAANYHDRTIGDLNANRKHEFSTWHSFTYRDCNSKDRSWRNR